MIKIIQFLILTVFLACNTRPKPDEIITLDKRFTIEIPDFLNNRRKLSSNAIFQRSDYYQNLGLVIKKLDATPGYLVLSSKTKHHCIADNVGVDSISSMEFEVIKDNISNISEQERYEIKKNGIVGEVLKIGGYFNGVNSYIQIGTIRISSNFYTIFVFCEYSKKKRYIKAMNSIFSSLKIVD